MNREILFRGKQIDSGKWIYGLPESEVVMVFTTPSGDFDGEFIDPNTVGQYTGLKDKDGTKIFEGDIVKCEEWYIGGPADSTVILSVKFSDGGYVAEQYPLSNWLFDSINGNDKLEGVTIIGNIYDNQELIPSCQ